MSVLSTVRLKKHPHERGEDLSPARLLVVVLETPPRAWGRLLMAEVEAVGVGNTPTSVGKTKDHYSQNQTYGKHPHERGEDSVILLDFITQKIGSILVANELQAIQ